MNYSNDYFDIYFVPSCEEYKDTIIETVNSSLDEYLTFFNLSELNKKVLIKFYDDLDEFKKYYEISHNKPYKSGVVGLANGNEIHMLSFRERIKERPQDDFNRFLMGIKHELVHICHIAYKGNSKGSWLAEGFATYLGSPRYEETLEGCTIDDLMGRKKYKYCYTLTKYLIEHYPHEKVLEYAADEELLIKDTDILLEEAMNYYKKRAK